MASSARQRQQSNEEDEESASSLDVGSLQRRLKAQLVQQQAVCADAMAENQRLERRTAALEREHYETAALLRREMLAKAAEAERLQAQLDEAGRQRQVAAADAAAREAALLAAFEAERVLLHQQAAALQAKLDSLREAEERQVAVAAEVQALRERLEAQEAEYQLKVRGLLRELHQYRPAEEGGEEGAGAGAGSDEDDEEVGGDLASADIVRLLQHNRKMNEQMRLFGEEADELQKQMRALESERSGLLRDVRLKEELEQQYARRGTLQAREIRDAKSKISTLERGMVELATAHEQEKAVLSQELRAQLAEAVGEQASLRRLLRLRTTELHRVRRLAQEVLLQRSDVESFLISSILHVRAEVAAAAAAGGAAPAAAAAAAAGAGAKQGSAPAAGGGGPAGAAALLPQGSGSGGGAPSAPAASASRVDVKDLSWADREHVLRLLFAKINHQAAAAATAAALPGHGLSTERTEAPTAAQASLRGAWAEAGPAGLA
eukprot:scaffold5.g647.t1